MILNFAKLLQLRGLPDKIAIIKDLSGTELAIVISERREKILVILITTITWS